MVNSRNEIKQLVNFLYLRSRPRRTAIFSSDTDGFTISQSDVITITEADSGLDKTKFTVEKVKRDFSGKKLGQTTITAIEYFDDDYTGDSEIPTHKHLPVSNKWEVLPPTNLKFEVLSLSDSGIGRLTWSASTSQDVREYEIKYRKNGSSDWTSYDNTQLTSTTISNLSGIYDFSVTAKNRFGVTSTEIAISKIDIRDKTVYPAPKKIELITENVNKTISESPDWNVTWDDVKLTALPSSANVEQFGKEYLAYFSYYEVTVKKGAVVARVDRTTMNRYTYSYDTALSDGLSRDLIFEVRFVAKSGVKSQPAVLIAKNPQCGAVTGLTVNGGLSSLFVSFDFPKDMDYAGTKIHISKTKGFKPSDDNLIATLKDTNIFTKAFGANEKGNYYCRVGCFDVFDKVGITYSEERAFSMTSINDELTNIDEIDLAPELIAKINKIEVNETNIANEQKIREQQDSSLAQQITTVSAKSKEDIAAVASRVTKAETDIKGKASVADVQTWQTQASGKIASVENSVKSIDGKLAQTVIKTDANGYVAGFGLISDATAKESAVMFAADKFMVLGSKADITKPPSKSKVVPFEVSDGKVKIKNAMIENLDADVISTGKFTGDRISADAITGNHISSNTTIYAGKTNEAGEPASDNIAAMSGLGPWRFWSGNRAASAAPFRVSESGFLYASDAHIEGSIHAKSGTFTGEIKGGSIEGVVIRGSVIEGGISITGTTEITVPTDADNKDVQPRYLASATESYSTDGYFNEGKTASTLSASGDGISIYSFNHNTSGVDDLTVNDVKFKYYKPLGRYKRQYIKPRFDFRNVVPGRMTVGGNFSPSGSTNYNYNTLTIEIVGHLDDGKQISKKSNPINLRIPFNGQLLHGSGVHHPNLVNPGKDREKWTHDAGPFTIECDVDYNKYARTALFWDRTDYVNSMNIKLVSWKEGIPYSGNAKLIKITGRLMFSGQYFYDASRMDDIQTSMLFFVNDLNNGHWYNKK